MPGSSDRRTRYYSRTREGDALGRLPALISATATLAAFDTSDADRLYARLGVHEYLQTALAGANNDFVIIARTPGDTNVRLALVDPAANNRALSVSVSGQDITVSLATGAGGAITSTGAQVVAAINAHSVASQLVVASLAAANDGTGVVVALAFAAVVGPQGTTPTADVKLQSTMDGTNWWDVGTFPQQTAVNTYEKVFAPIGSQCRWVVTIGGTTPVFALSLDVQVQR